MLELNSNRLKHMGTVQGLQGCVRLRYAALFRFTTERQYVLKRNFRHLSLYWNAVTKIPNYRQKMLHLVPSLLVLDKIVVNSGDFPHLNVFQDEHPEQLLTVDAPEPPMALQGQHAVEYLSVLKSTVYRSWGSRSIITLQRCLRGHIARQFALAFLRKKLKIRNAITVGMAVRALGGARNGVGEECQRLVKCLSTAFGSGQRALLDTLPVLDDEDIWTSKRMCDVYADPRQAYFLQQLLEIAAPQQHDMGWSCVSVWRRSLRWASTGDKVAGDALLRVAHCFAKRPFMWLRSRPSLKMVSSSGSSCCKYRASHTRTRRLRTSS